MCLPTTVQEQRVGYGGLLAAPQGCQQACPADSAAIACGATRKDAGHVERDRREPAELRLRSAQPLISSPSRPGALEGCHRGHHSRLGKNPEGRWHAPGWSRSTRSGPTSCSLSLRTAGGCGGGGCGYVSNGWLALVGLRSLAPEGLSLLETTWELLRYLAVLPSGGRGETPSPLSARRLRRWHL